MQQGITIAKIAKDLGLNPSTIVSIEDGKNSTSFINVYLLCKHLDINFPYFLETISIQ
jgi:DNA-binding XRE family transcriptional regulator